MSRVLTAAGARHAAGLGLCRYDGVGPDEAWPSYVGSMPDTPHRALCWYPRPGPPPDVASPWAYPQVQVMARDEPGRSRPSHDVLQDLVDALHGTHNVTWAGGTADEVFVTRCTVIVSGIVDLGRDAQQRPQHTVTFQLETAPVE